MSSSFPTAFFLDSNDVLQVGTTAQIETGVLAGRSSPSVDFTFKTGGIDPSITFARASTATYFDATGTMRTAGNNVPRFDYDPVSHAVLGLLVEETRTNIDLWSSDFTNAVWTKSSGTITSNITTAPDGTATADRIVEAAASASHGVFQLNAKAASAIVYTYSVFLKADTRSVARVMMEGSVSGSALCDFNLGAGTSTSVTLSGGWATGSKVMTPLSNGWYRCSITATSNTDTGVYTDVYMINSVTPYAGDGTSGLFVWGAQLEVGPFATSYIPTVGATATRSADSATLPVGTWYNSTASSLAAEFIVPYASIAAGNPVVLEVGELAKTDSLDIRLQANNGIVATSFSANANKGSTAATAWTAGAIAKAAASFTAATTSLSVNGAAVASIVPTAYPVPGVITQVVIGDGRLGPLNGYVRRVRYWPRALTNSELQQLSN